MLGLAGRACPTKCFGYNAVVERFFESLKHDWITKVHQPIREHMVDDVCAYIKYYNFDRLHSSSNDLSPIQYESLAN